MKLFLLLVLLSSTSYVSSRSNGQYLRDNEDEFEDVLLERLHALRRDQERYGSYLYDDEADEEDVPKYSRDDLMHVLNELKRKTHDNSQKAYKNSVQHEIYHNDIADENKRESAHSSLKERKTSSLEYYNSDSTVQKKRAVFNNDDIKNVNIDSKKREVAATVNNQVASVVPDDSLAKQNEIDQAVNLRDVLEDPVTNAPNLTTRKDSKQPSHSYIKETKSSNRANKAGLDKVSFIAVVAGCCVAAIAGIALATYCWYKLRAEKNDKDEIEKQKEKAKNTPEKKKRAGSKEKPLSDDEKMVKNAEMYHYHHAKNQIQQLGQHATDGKNFHSGETSDEDDNEDTVYECPGLAAPGDMRVVNPMFSDNESVHHSDRQSENTSHGGTPTPPNERIEQLTKQQDP